MGWDALYGGLVRLSLPISRFAKAGYSLSISYVSWCSMIQRYVNHRLAPNGEAFDVERSIADQEAYIRCMIMHGAPKLPKTERES